MSTQLILNGLEKRLAFHHRWSQIWSVAFFTIAASSVVSAALASASAGFISDTGEGKMRTDGGGPRTA